MKRTIVKYPKKFRNQVVEKLHEYADIPHKGSCKCSRGWHLTGFRPISRKVVTVGGSCIEYPIMIQCKECGVKISLLPSFLPREKNFAIEIIGNVCEGIVRFGGSINSALSKAKMFCAGRGVKQTILNWIKWMGTKHPAIILTKAGIKGSGYIQEDEAFEKEPNLRTYLIAMVDSKNQIVWHVDYVDHVDEKTFCGSFAQFIKWTSFKLLGVTKDKWNASTMAFKSMFHGLWIGFCHRHCLDNMWKALEAYQKETKCSRSETKKLYREFKNILENSASKVILKIKANWLLKEYSAFNHPILKVRMDELKTNGERYTSHKNRKGITKTTSLVDNFLKQVKRKLKQVESFRDKISTTLLFRTMATIRNFAPFLSGAKNAHKSPFMLAGGQTYDLPWIQTMNVHNAFLFTDTYL